MRLLEKETGRCLLEELSEADGFFSRLKGFLGCREIGPERGILFPNCPSIHTFFMQVPIDAVFLDPGLRVLEICENIGPGRIIRHNPGRNVHVLETRAGWVRDHGVKEGDVFEVRG